MSRWLDAQNILAIRLDNIGDVIMLGPALRAIKETSTDARLTLLASSSGATAIPLLPWIDDVIVYHAQWQPRSTSSRLLRRETACHPCYLFECPI
jgi:ADP-heptose:LPS heptosyltransferase